MGLEPRGGTGTRPKPRLGLEGAVFLLLLLKYFMYLFYLFVCIRSCFGTGELHCIRQDLSFRALYSLVVLCGLSYPLLPQPRIEPMALVVAAQSSNHWTKEFPKLRFLTSCSRKNSVRDKVIGKNWIYLERYTFHRQNVVDLKRQDGPWEKYISQSVDHLRRWEAWKFWVVSFYGLNTSVSEGVGELFCFSEGLRVFKNRDTPNFGSFMVSLWRTVMVLASVVAQRVKHLPGMRETRVRFLGWEDPLEKEMATLVG